MSANCSWLVMSNHKDDIRIIDATSDLNACLSYFHRVNQTEGSNVMHYRDGKMIGYPNVLQAADDFFKKKIQLSRNTIFVRTEEPVGVKNRRATSEVSGGSCLNPKCSSKFAKGNIVSIWLSFTCIFEKPVGWSTEDFLLLCVVQNIKASMNFCQRMRNGCMTSAAQQVTRPKIC